MNMPIVPNTHTNTKIHRKRRSITMATYFQSSLTCGWGGTKGVQDGVKRQIKVSSHTLLPFSMQRVNGGEGLMCAGTRSAT